MVAVGSEGLVLGAQASPPAKLDSVVLVVRGQARTPALPARGLLIGLV